MNVFSHLVLFVTVVLALQKKIECRKDGWGYGRETGRKTSFRVDVAAGGPIGAFKIGRGHMFLPVRSAASRRSDNGVKLKPGSGGFAVDHAGYRRTIERTRKSPVRQHPLKRKERAAETRAGQ